ncbi:MAG: HTH-type transcriptional activator IlvY [Cephaloticoccus sp.]|nr:HTH-type transcriptional activator IlvY [Cephaloticoccus sp.]
MTPHDLRLFLQLSRTLNFNRASQEAHLAPSTLTRTIQRLESAAGTTLFERNKQRVALTPAGRLFLDYARETLSGWESIQAQMKATKGILTGTLRLFCTVTASYSILPDILPAFLKRHPKVSLQLITGDAADTLTRVIDGSADLSVAVLPSILPSELAHRILVRSPVIWIAPNETDNPINKMLRQRPIPWSELPLIVPESGDLRDNVLTAIRKHCGTPKIAGTVSGHEAILALVGLGLGVGALPKLVLERSVFSTHVRPFSPRLPLQGIKVGLCVRKQRLSDPCVRAFWDALPNTKQG